MKRPSELPSLAGVTGGESATIFRVGGVVATSYETPWRELGGALVVIGVVTQVRFLPNPLGSI